MEVHLRLRQQVRENILALSVDDAFSSVYNIEMEDFYGTKIKSF